MTDPYYVLDVYMHKARKLAIIVRRQLPYHDDRGKYHPGTQPGIGVWFSKRKYAASGRVGATASALTSASHAIMNTEPEDWNEFTWDELCKMCSDVPVGGWPRSAINKARHSLGTKLEAEGFTFVGNKDHSIGDGMKKGQPSAHRLKSDVEDYLWNSNSGVRPSLVKVIEQMTRYTDVDIVGNAQLMSELRARCHYPDRAEGEEIITVSDLFSAICEIVELNE